MGSNDATADQAAGKDTAIQPQIGTKENTRPRRPLPTGRPTPQQPLEPGHRAWMDVLSEDDEEDEDIEKGGESKYERYTSSLKHPKGTPWTHEEKIYMCTNMGGINLKLHSKARALAHKGVAEVLGRDHTVIEGKIRHDPASIYYKIQFPLDNNDCSHVDASEDDAGKNKDGENKDGKTEDREKEDGKNNGSTGMVSVKGEEAFGSGGGNSPSCPCPGGC